MRKIKKILFIIIALVIAGIYAYGTWPRAIYDTDIGSGSYESTEPLGSGSIFEQEFLCEDTGFSGFTIKLNKQGNDKIGNYEWSIKNIESEEVIASGIINETSTETKKFESSDPQKQGIVEVQIPRQQDSKNKRYLLTLSSEHVEEDETVTIYVTEKGTEKAAMMINGDVEDKAAVIKVLYKRFNAETFLVFIGIIVYFALFIRFMYKLFR